jgi:hypothetical protein
MGDLLLAEGMGLGLDMPNLEYSLNAVKSR